MKPEGYEKSIEEACRAANVLMSSNLEEGVIGTQYWWYTKVGYFVRVLYAILWTAVF